MSYIIFLSIIYTLKISSQLKISLKLHSIIAIFFNFLPEIQEYDHEYAELMIKNKVNENSDEKFKLFIALV